jgi:hypothetical protein
MPAPITATPIRLSAMAVSPIVSFLSQT